MCVSNGPGVVHVKIYMTVNGWTEPPSVMLKPGLPYPEGFGFAYQGPGTYLALEKDYQDVPEGDWSVFVGAGEGAYQFLNVPASAGKEIWLTFSGVGGSDGGTDWFNWDPVDENPDGGCARSDCLRNANCLQCLPGKTTTRLGSVDVEVSLGKASFGRPAGTLRIKADQPDAVLATSAALKLSGPRQVSVVRSNNALRQVSAPKTLADIVTVNEFRYEIRLFSPSATKTNDLYVTNGVPFSTVVVENPQQTTNDVSRLRITADGRVSDYQWDGAAGRWELTTGGGLRKQARSSVWESGGTIRVDTNQIWNGTQWLTENIERWKVIGSQTNIIQRIVDPNGTAQSNEWTYCDDVSTSDPRFGLLRQRIESTGYWERFDYDSAARLTKTVTQFLNAPTNAAESTCRVITNLYSATAPHLTRITTVMGQEIARSYQLTNTAETVDIHCLTAGAAWNAADNLVTTNKTYASGPFQGESQSTSRPDGTVSLFGYSINANGQKCTTNQTGFGSASSVTDGTCTIRTVDMAGNLRAETILDIASGLQIGSQASLTNDLHGRPLTVAGSGGTNETTYGCCGVTWTRDAEGIGTYFGYDALQRLITTERAGVTTSNVFDAADRLIATFRNGALISSNAYNLAGQLLSSTDALDQTTTYSETRNQDGETVKSTTYPDTSTRIETYYQDGRLKSLTGTAVHGVRYEYGVELDSGAYRQFTKEIKLLANGTDSGEWTKTYTDMLGRAVKTVVSGQSSAFSQSEYNNKGQLVKQVDADGVTVLYGYNHRGERIITALDMDRDGGIGTGDRIQSNATSVVQTDLGVTQQTRTWEYSESGPVLVAATETSVDGLRSRSISFGLTNSTVTVLDRPNATRTVTTTAADGTQTASVFENGRATTVTTSHQQLGTLSSAGYTHDSRGRQSSVSDGRNVTTAYAYNEADQLIAVTKAVGLTEQQVTRFILDEPNRRRITVQADGGAVTNEYWATGELKKTWGTRTYPVEYEYDYAGRLKTMKTWQDFASDTGSAVTTWNYDAQTGRLNGKRLADNTGPDYTYTLAGRLLTRTWARGITTTYTNNAAGEMLGIDYSDATPDVSFTYDRRGRRTAVTTGTNPAASAYNDASQLLTETFPLAGVTVTNTYDALSRQEWLLVGTAGPAVRFDYDSASRLSSVSAGTLSAAYAYTPHLPGLVSNITFTAGGTNRLVTTKTYDNLNRLSAISHQLSAGNPLSRAYQYNAANQRTQRTDEDGSYRQYGYDSLGQVTNAVRRWSDNALVAGQSHGFQYDDIGNRKSAQSGGPSSTSTYSANLLNQYTQRTVPGAVDVTGLATNAATVTVNNIRASRHGEYFHTQVPVPNTASPRYTNLITVGVLKNAGSNQMDIVATKTGAVFVAQSPEQFTHDDDGNVTNDGRFTYTWDAENRLIGVETLTNLPASVPRQKLLFAYDASFRRVSKVVSNWTGSSWTCATDLRFVYDGWNLVAELGTTGSVVRSYVWGLDLSGSTSGAGGVGGLLWQTDHLSSSVSICGYDGNGNVVALVAAGTGTLAGEYEYGPFGEAIRATGVAATGNPFRFSTKYTDTETGLVMYPYRPYAPSLGCWLTPDPLGEAGGLNLYGFVYNAGPNGVDPLGLILFDDSESFWLLWLGRGLDPRARWEDTGDSLRVAQAYSHGFVKSGVQLVPSLAKTAWQLQQLQWRAVTDPRGHYLWMKSNWHRLSSISWDQMRQQASCLLQSKYKDFNNMSVERQEELIGEIIGDLTFLWATGASMEAGLTGELAGKSSLTAKNIQLAQKGVRNTFTTIEEGSNFKFAGQSIREVAEGLRAGRISPSEIPVEYVVINGDRFAVNNRSLTALRRAGLQPTVTRNVTSDLVKLRRVQQRLLEIDKLGLPRDATTIRGIVGLFSTLE